MATLTMTRAPWRRASIAPAWSRNERITPPKIVPCAFVSRGIMSTRIAGSFHFARISNRLQARLLGRRVALYHDRVDLDLRFFSQSLQKHRSQISRLLLPKHLGVRGAILIGGLRIDFLLIDDLQYHRTI